MYPFGAELKANWNVYVNGIDVQPYKSIIRSSVKPLDALPVYSCKSISSLRQYNADCKIYMLLKYVL